VHSRAFSFGSDAAKCVEMRNTSCFSKLNIAKEITLCFQVTFVPARCEDIPV